MSGGGRTACRGTFVMAKARAEFSQSQWREVGWSVKLISARLLRN